MLSRRPLLPLALLGTSLLFGCPPEEGPDVTPPTPRAVTAEALLQDANRNLRTHLMGAEGSIDGIDVEGLLEIIPIDDTPSVPCPPDEICDEPEPPVSDTPDAEAIAAMMAEEVLNVAHVEETIATAITLRFDAAMCPASGETNTPDPECVRQAAQLQPRLRLSSLRVGDVDASLQVGASREEIARLELHAGRLAIEIDLGAAKRAALTLAPSIDGFPAEALDALRAATVQGRLRAALAPTNGGYAASLSVPTKILLATTFEAEPVRLEIERTSRPLVQLLARPTGTPLELSGSPQGMALVAPIRLFMGATSAPCTTGPDGETNCDEPAELPNIAGSLELRAPAADYALTVHDSGGVSMALSSSGPTTAKLDGRTLLQAELDGARAGQLLVELVQLQDGLRVDAANGMHATVEFALAPIAEHLEVPRWLQSERLDVRLDPGASADAALFFSDSGSMRVLDGRLTIDSRAANRQIVVNEGQCLVGVGTEPSEDAHPLTYVEGGVCE